MTDSKDQRQYLYDSEDSAGYFMEGLVMDQREDAYAAEKEHLTQRSRRMRQISAWLNGVSPDPMNPANLKVNAGLVSTFWKDYCEMYKVNEGATVPDWWGFEWAAYALARYEQLGIEQKTGEINDKSGWVYDPGQALANLRRAESASDAILRALRQFDYADREKEMGAKLIYFANARAILEDYISLAMKSV